ncbi:Cell surface glycoprotein CD200 receptor 1 [Manis javanica]|nr:Cell surface glycoprotein CD200 receptor 1 [Manis javanica]
MPCTWGTSDLWLSGFLTVFLVAGVFSESIHTGTEGPAKPHSSSVQQTAKDNYSLALINNSPVDGEQSSLVAPAEAYTSLSVPVDTKAVLCCPPILLTAVVVATWEITFRDNSSCTRAYRRDNNETKDSNCMDTRITWVSRPDQNPALQIDPVATTHDGNYTCEMVTPNGNFRHGYYLQVLVPPEVTLFQSGNGTTVCKAAAGKPAAQISWTPEGTCVTEQEHWDDGTVTVQSTCSWEGHRVPNVSCSVSHVTGNKSLSLALGPGTQTPDLKILYIILSIFIISATVGSIWLLNIGGCRKCKLKKTEATPVVEEDEMQPYASYTEKKNPLYDTVNKVKTSQVLQSEVDELGLNISFIGI